MFHNIFLWYMGIGVVIGLAVILNAEVDIKVEKNNEETSPKYPKISFVLLMSLFWFVFLPKILQQLKK